MKTLLSGFFGGAFALAFGAAIARAVVELIRLVLAALGVM